MPDFGMPDWDSMVAAAGRRGIVPDPAQVKFGMEQARYAKEPVKITSYHVEVFDMSSRSDRDKYSKLMLELAPKVQDSACTLCRNELQVLGNGWWRYVEWFEYTLNVPGARAGETDDSSEDSKKDSASGDGENKDWGGLE